MIVVSRMQLLASSRLVKMVVGCCSQSSPESRNSRGRAVCEALELKVCLGQNALARIAPPTRWQAYITHSISRDMSCVSSNKQMSRAESITTQKRPAEASCISGPCAERIGWKPWAHVREERCLEYDLFNFFIFGCIYVSRKCILFWVFCFGYFTFYFSKKSFIVFLLLWFCSHLLFLRLQLFHTRTMDYMSPEARVVLSWAICRTAHREACLAASFL